MKRYVVRNITYYNISVKGIDISTQEVVVKTFYEPLPVSNVQKFLASITTDQFKPSFIVDQTQCKEKRGLTFTQFMKISIPMKDYRKPL